MSSLQETVHQPCDVTMLQCHRLQSLQSAEVTGELIDDRLLDDNNVFRPMKENAGSNLARIVRRES